MKFQRPLVSEIITRPLQYYRISDPASIAKGRNSQCLVVCAPHSRLNVSVLPLPSDR